MTEKRQLLQADILDCITSEESYKVGVKTTVVVLTLKNGFEVVGVSGCVDPVNYNHEIGTSIARTRAIDKVWELEGYLLQSQINKNVEHTRVDGEEI